MGAITSTSSLEEIAARVSEALEAAGIQAVLGGGAAVTLYSANEYMSTDLDFVTVARNKEIATIVAELGFVRDGKDFVHPETPYFLEFPAGPLSFGDRYVDSTETTFINTPFGRVRIITPTQCIMDRLAWHIHGPDPQALDQAIMVAKRQDINWDDIEAWAAAEGVAADVLTKIRNRAGSNR